MKKSRPIFLILLLWLIMSDVWLLARADNYDNAPEPLQAALLLKVLALDNDINTGSEVSIHVINSPGVAELLKKAIGKKIGKSVLTNITQGPELPSRKPSVIFVGNSADISKVTRYTRTNKILSVTGIPDLVAKGVTLGIAALRGKPKLLLNLVASENEEVKWNPALLKISTIIKKKES